VERALVDGVTLEYEEAGAGDPVVGIHGALVADVFRPLLEEQALVARHRLIAYRRRGYGGSSKPDRPLSIHEQAADCLRLLRHLGLERVHLVGHSLGGCIALQVALDAPEAVRSLVLLEPALAVGSTGEAYRASLAAGIERYRSEDTATLVNQFMDARSPGYRELLERRLPGALEQAIAEAGTAFEIDTPGLLDWSFGEADAHRISQPVLSVLGGDSNALWSRFGEVHRLLLEWFPSAEGFVLPGTTHFLQVEKPGEMAEALVEFYAGEARD
jgi:pimeloyl-ACP methyl ester carboxylesterase